MTYIYQLEGWPHFRWSSEQLAERLAAVRHKQGRLIGRMERLGFNLRAEAALQAPHRVDRVIAQFVHRLPGVSVWTSVRLLPPIDMSRVLSR